MKIKKGGFWFIEGPNVINIFKSNASNQVPFWFYFTLLLFIIIGIPLILAFTIGGRAPLL
jgi:hypothetical protein